LVTGQELNFRRAAARLRLSPSALSQSVRQLEERLGTRLLNRTTRSVALTEAGRDLLARLAPAFAEIAGAVEATSDVQERPAGTVRLNLPRLAADLVLAPAFGRFANLYPDVHLDVVVDDGLVDIVAGGFDAGVRPGERVHRDMVAVRVTGPLRTAVVGAPAYLARRPAPLTPDDLRDHLCINYRWTGSGAVYDWEFAQGERRFEVAVDGPVTLNNTDLMVAAALEGAGLAYLLEDRVAGHLASGRLRRVLDGWCRSMPGFFLYYPSRRQMRPGLRALVDFLRVDGTGSSPAPIVEPSPRQGDTSRGSDAEEREKRPDKAATGSEQAR
jgi:DNA-binding transcriptional LysR family regulator